MEEEPVNVAEDEPGTVRDGRAHLAFAFGERRLNKERAFWGDSPQPTSLWSAWLKRGPFLCVRRAALVPAPFLGC